MLKAAMEGRLSHGALKQLPPADIMEVLRSRGKLMQPEELSELLNKLPAEYGPQIVAEMPVFAIRHLKSLPSYVVQVLALEMPHEAVHVRFQLWAETIDTLVERHPRDAVTLRGVLTEEQIDKLLKTVPASTVRHLTNYLTERQITRCIQDKNTRILAKHLLKHRFNYQHSLLLRSLED